MSLIENPWLDISWNKTIPDCDWYYFALLGAKSKGIIKGDEFNFVTKEIEDYIFTQGKFDIVKEKVIQLLEPENIKPEALVNEWIVKHNIQLNTLPEPYTGDPESNVYLLNMNPGRRDEEFEKIECNRLKYELLTKLTLSHQLKHSMWYHMKGHDGYSWIKNKTNQLCQDMPYPRFFMVEFFPYHSAKGFDFPFYLPSYSYTNKLLNEAVNKKTIIVMRNYDRWIERLPCNVDMSLLMKLKNKQNVSISKNNIEFNSIINNFKDLVRMF